MGGIKLKLLQLININVKRMVKNKASIMLTLLLPMVVVLGLGFIFNRESDSKKTYYMVNNDNGSYGEKLVKELSKDYNIKLYSKESAMERLKKKTIVEFYEIGEKFSSELKEGKRSHILANRRENVQSFSDFEAKANNLLNKLMISSEIEAASGEKVSIDYFNSVKVKTNVISTKSTTIGDQLVINLLVSFSLFSSIGMCLELFGLKSERTLSRSLTTANKPQTIIGAILGGQYIIVAVVYIVLYFMYVFIFNKGLFMQAPVVILNLLMTIAVSLSLAVFVSRIIKNKNLIPIVLQIVLCGTCFIGGSFMPVDMLPDSIARFSKFTPQYWAVQSISTGKFQYSLIVLLFAVLLFTGGTVSARSFANID
jgi:ABC-2 type transport system permease protein